MLWPLAPHDEHPLRDVFTVLIIGVVTGTMGHIIRSQTMIIAGIVIIGLVSAYFTFQFLAQP